MAIPHDTLSDADLRHLIAQARSRPPASLSYHNDVGLLVPAPAGSFPVTEISHWNTLEASILERSEPSTKIPPHFQDDAHAAPCRLWLGPWTKRGYGYITIWQGQRNFMAGPHRVRLAVRDGCWPRGLFARHLCHVSACVEVSHLAWGSYSANKHDDAARMTRLFQHQLRPGNIPLARGQEIRRVAATSGLSFDSLVLLTGLHPTNLRELLDLPDESIFGPASP